MYIHGSFHKTWKAFCGQKYGNTGYGIHTYNRIYFVMHVKRNMKRAWCWRFLHFLSLNLPVIWYNTNIQYSHGAALNISILSVWIHYLTSDSCWHIMAMYSHVELRLWIFCSRLSQKSSRRYSTVIEGSANHIVITLYSHVDLMSSIDKGGK